MNPDVERITEPQAVTRGNDPADQTDTAIEVFDGRFRLGIFAERGLDLGSLSDNEMNDLEAFARERLSPVFDQIVERWQDENGKLTDAEKVDRELRRRIETQRDRLTSDYECEGCGSRHSNLDMFVSFHGLLLCDCCEEEARDELRDIQRPLTEALEAEPTLEHARTLGFELRRRDDGRLAWIGEDDDYDGGSCPYASEDAALEDLVEELTVGF